MNVILSQPRGFCAGVVRAVDLVDTALEKFGRPVYVLHEIVHNRWVVDDLRQRGAVFVEHLHEVPDGVVVVFSAHGVSARLHRAAAARQLRVVDATCPLVHKVHLQVRRCDEAGKDIVLIGHAGHREVEGTRGQATRPMHVVSSPADVAALEVRDPNAIAYVTQTTLSMEDAREVIDALVERFPTIEGPELDDICYATQNRQNAVRQLAPHIDVLLVVGAANSSNSNRLREVGERHGVEAHLVGGADDVEPAWFAPDSTIGLTAGASTPESLVRAVLDRLRRLGVRNVRDMDGVAETAVFPASIPVFPAQL